MSKYIVQMSYGGVFVRRVRIENASKYDLSGELVGDYVETLFGDAPLAFDEETLANSETYKLQHIGDPAIGCFLSIRVTDPRHLDEENMPENGKELSEQEKIDFFAHEVYETPSMEEGLSWEAAINKVPYHFVCDGELFPAHDYSNDAGYLTLEGYEKDWYEAVLETEGEFDPSKLEIHYKSYRSGDGSTNYVSRWMSYDGKILDVHQSHIYNSHGDSEHYVKMAWVDSSLGRIVYKAEEVREDEGDNFFSMEYRWKKDDGKITDPNSAVD